MTAEICLFPPSHRQFLGYLIHDPGDQGDRPIDAPEAGPVIKALEREGWTLTDVLITHHHGDHAGGVAELKQKYAPRMRRTTSRPGSQCRPAGQGDVTASRKPVGAGRNPGPYARPSAMYSTAKRRCSPPTPCFRSGAEGCLRAPTR